MQMVRYCVLPQGTERLIRRGIVGKSFSYLLALDSEASSHILPREGRGLSWKALNLTI